MCLFFPYCLEFISESTKSNGDYATRELSMSKLCRYCHKKKPLEQFVKDPTCKDGYRHICRLCKNAQRKKSDNLRRYGISTTELQALMQQAKGLCMLCRKKRKLHIDHDHATGRVRGLLCYRCNVFVWAVHENPQLAKSLTRKLPQYLQLFDQSSNDDSSRKSD